MHKFLLYAANLHVGGAIQVAASVIDELSRRPDDAAQVALLISSEVHANLQALAVPLDRFRGFRVEDHRGLVGVFKNMHTLVGDAEAMLTVFGPLYGLRPGVPNVVGFAQPWIIYPDNEIYRAMSWTAKLRTRLKFALQSWFFRRAHALVVELEHVRDGLVRRRIATAGRISVVRNCLSALYSEPERWEPLSPVLGQAPVKLGFVGRNYAHKNTAIFPEVKAILHREHALMVDIYVTFSDAEWASCSAEFKAAVHNVGPLRVAQCPSFYQQMDGVLFPSLLECFSATPLEALAMRRPLFASDRPFNRDVCGPFAHYFDPLDPGSAAAAIARYFANPAIRCDALEHGFHTVMAFPGPAERVDRYLACLRSAVAPRNV